jgi:flagellin-like protein
MKKGISPFISTVLLVAFAIAVAAIFGGWLTSFVQTTNKDVQEHSEKRVTCSYGGIALEDLKYNQTTGNFSGKVENTDIIVLGNIDFEIFYTDDTRAKLDLNITLEPGEKNSFNQNVNKMNTTGIINKIRTITNCSNVYDEATSSDVTFSY